MTHTIAIVSDDARRASAWQPRRITHAVRVTQGGRTCVIGGGAPVVVQSMTNTATEDVEATVAQVCALEAAGSGLVRLTVNTPEAARAVARIRDRLDGLGVDVPLVGDFHYNGPKRRTEDPQ